MRIQVAGQLKHYAHNILNLQLLNGLIGHTETMAKTDKLGVRSCKVDRLELIGQPIDLVRARVQRGGLEEEKKRVQDNFALICRHPHIFQSQPITLDLHFY